MSGRTDRPRSPLSDAIMIDTAVLLGFALAASGGLTRIVVQMTLECSATTIFGYKCAVALLFTYSQQLDA